MLSFIAGIIVGGGAVAAGVLLYPRVTAWLRTKLPTNG